MARRKAATPLPDPHGQVALMLCESLLHLLVEERIITKEKAMAAIDGVAELVREMAQEAEATRSRAARDHARAAVGIVESVRASFAAKSGT